MANSDDSAETLIEGLIPSYEQVSLELCDAHDAWLVTVTRCADAQAIAQALEEWQSLQQQRSLLLQSLNELAERRFARFLKRA